MIVQKEKLLKDIFKNETIEFLKNNKDQITSELLSEIRSFGNAGKHLALEILDFPKDSEQYYLDSFGNRISFNGNRRIKKQFTKLNLSPIHIEEIEKCSEDIHYYKDNYVKIKTKSGVDFPEVRSYQNDFISLLNSDEESIVGLMGRQSSKSISTSIYCSHLIVFDKEKNIIKNDFLFIDDDLIEELFLVKERRNYALEINEQQRRHSHRDHRRRDQPLPVHESAAARGWLR